MFPLKRSTPFCPSKKIFLRFWVDVYTPIIGTPLKTNIAMENGSFEDVFPIKNGDIPLLC